MRASDLLLDALKKEHAKRIKAAAPDERIGIATDCSMEMKAAMGLFSTIESRRPYWERDALDACVFAALGVDP